MKNNTVEYRGFIITVEELWIAGINQAFSATNNIGEDYMEIPFFTNAADAIRWDKQNIDTYLNENN